MSDYKMPEIGLFGKRCIIPHGISGTPFVYRIVNSGTLSNAWSELPLTYQSENNLTLHDYSTEVLIVVCDTLIDEKSKLVRVARKDVKLIDK